MWEDPVIAEIRQIRRELEAECNNNIEQIYRRAVERQKRYVGRLVAPLATVLTDISKV
jgi:hypothetical protein